MLRDARSWPGCGRPFHWARCPLWVDLSPQHLVAGTRGGTGLRHACRLDTVGQASQSCEQCAAGRHLWVHGTLLRGKDRCLRRCHRGWGRLGPRRAAGLDRVADQALWAGVLNSWFLGRVLDKVRR